MTIELSPGNAPDQIWMFQGELPTDLMKYLDSNTYNNNGNFFDPTDTQDLRFNNDCTIYLTQEVFSRTGSMVYYGISADALNMIQFEIEFNCM